MKSSLLGIFCFCLMFLTSCKETQVPATDCTPGVDCTCEAGSYLDATQNLCKETTSCKDSEFESLAATDTTDRECSSLTVCLAGEYESAAASSTSDRECAPLSECMDTEYEAVAATLTSDRACASLTECTDGEYESAAASSTSDRECEALSECMDAEYEAVAATLTSDRECTPLTVCTSDEYETVAPTATSDRECSACSCIYGSCDGEGVCFCESGWTGQLCDVPDPFNAPESMRITVDKEGATRTFVLSQYSVRAASGMPVKIVNANGSVSDYTASNSIPTYRGYCEEEPDAWVGATLLPSGALRYQVIKGNPYEDWEFVPQEEFGPSDPEITYNVIGGDPAARSGVPLPEASFTASNSGEQALYSNVYRSDFAVIITKDYMDRFNYDMATVIRKIEDTVARMNGNYIRDVLLEARVSHVIVRNDEMTDWDQGRSQFESYFPGVYPNNIVSVVNENGSGLAYVCFLGGENALSYVNRYAVAKSGISDDGSFYGVWRHEYGHNQGSGHYEGGAPEGATIMSGNSLSRFSKYEVEVIMACRDRSDGSALRFKESLGSYEDFPIPPYAQLDDDIAVDGSSDDTAIDVLANDYDANGDDIAISGLDATSELGGMVALEETTGPDARDQLVYTPPSGFLSPVTVGSCDPGTQLDPADCASCVSYWDTSTVSCSDSTACAQSEVCVAGECRVALGCDGTQLIDACGQPCPVPSLQVWVDSSDLENLEDTAGNRGSDLSHGAEITTVFDRSGNQNDALCYNNNRRPALQLEGPNHLNNRGSLHFLEDFVEIRGVDLNEASNDTVTSIAALRHISGAGGRLVWVQRKNGFDSRRHAALNTPDGVTSVTSAVLDLGEEASSYWYNTAEQESSPETIFESGGAGLGIGAMLYANQGYTGAYFGDFVLGELLIYNQALTNDELRDIQSYLIKKWGVTIRDKFRYTVVDTSGLKSSGEVHLNLE